MSDKNSGDIQPSALSEKVSSIVSALLGSDCNAITVAGSEFASLATDRAPDLMKNISLEQFNQLSAQTQSKTYYFVLLFAYQLCVISDRLGEFCYKFFGNDLHVTIQWVCRIGNAVEYPFDTEEPADFRNDTWQVCIALIDIICHQYRCLYEDDSYALQIGLCFLQRVLYLCKSNACAMRAIHVMAKYVDRGTNAPGMLTAVLPHAIVGGEICFEAQVFLYQYFRKSCVQPGDFAFLSQREFVDAFVTLIHKSVQGNQILEISTFEHYCERIFHPSLLTVLLRVCHQAIGTYNTHELCQALGTTMLDNSIFFDGRTADDTGMAAVLAGQVAMDHWDEQLTVTDDNVYRVLAATLMTMRLFVVMVNLRLFNSPLARRYEITQSVSRRQILLRARQSITCFIPYADQISRADKQAHLCSESRLGVERAALIFNRALYAYRAVQVLVGLAALDLPALVTYEILEADTPTDDFTMYYKWRLITAVKHFR